MSRRSARIQSKQVQIGQGPKLGSSDSAASDDAEDDDWDELSRRSGPAHKKKRTSAPTAVSVKKRRGGKLKSFPEMPLDILFEVFSHLEPYDILRLSRSTKPLRAILMKRSSAFIWKEARANVPGLPECPPQLSEPAYANLVFDPHCHFCGAPGAGTIHWYFFRKVCKACDIESPLDSLYAGCLMDYSAGLGIRSDAICYDSAVLPLFRDNFIPEELTSVLQSFAALGDDEARQAWWNERRAEEQERRGFALAAAAWLKALKVKRGNELDDIKARRYTAIKKRLREEGWADVVDNLDYSESRELSKHRLVRQNKDLTDRIWQNIKGDIFELCGRFRIAQHERLLTSVRKQRIANFKKAFDAYCQTLPYDAVVIPIANVGHLEPLKNIIADDRVDFLPSESEFAAILEPNMRSFTDKWKSELEEYLLHLLSTTDGELPDVENKSSVLYRATSLFKCKRCHSDTLPFTAVLSHQCWRSFYGILGRHTVMDLLCEQAFMSRLVEPDNFELDESARKGIGAILRACGLSKTARVEELNAADPFLECDCSDAACRYHRAEGVRHVMQWPVAVHHHIPRFKLISYRELANFTRPAKPESGDRLGSYSRCFGCRHCYSPRPLSFSDVQSHLSSAHNIEIQSRESMEHYTLHPSISPSNYAYVNRMSYPSMYFGVPLDYQDLLGV